MQLGPALRKCGFVLLVSCLPACDGAVDQPANVSSDAGQPDAAVDSAAAEAGATDDQGDAADDTAPTVGDCGCPLGDGPYCGARAMAAASARGCTLDAAVGQADTLYHCEAGVWTVGAECPGTCAFDDGLADLDDACQLPVCDCFVQVAWCGSGAAKVAEERGCTIPLLPESNGDILYCPSGEWAVREACDDGCVEAPTGTPDYCKTQSDYLLPVACPQVARCTNGNDTSTHTGKDHYAYDFGMPIGTDVVAMRGGTVHRVRTPSPPGSACHEGGGTSCANYANTVEILHPDGTIGLYMHLKRGTVSQGQLVRQGEKVGVSGNSGWSTGPHTHVQVQRNCGSWWCQSIPFRFGEGPMSRGSERESQNCPPE